MGILDNLFRGKAQGEKPMPTTVSTAKPVDFPLDGENRPWGSFVNLAEGGKWHVKILEVSPSRRLSLQSHEKREEYMILLDGDCKIQINEDVHEMHQATMYFIPIGAKHRLSSVNGGRVLEVSRGEFQEGDIIRYEDDHGRVA